MRMQLLGRRLLEGASLVFCVFLTGSGFLWRYPATIWFHRWRVSNAWRWPPAEAFQDDEYPSPEPPWTTVKEMAQTVLWNAPRRLLVYVFLSPDVFLCDAFVAVLRLTGAKNFHFALAGDRLIALGRRAEWRMGRGTLHLHQDEEKALDLPAQQQPGTSGPPSSPSGAPAFELVGGRRRFLYRSGIGRQCASMFHRAAEKQPLPGSGTQSRDGSCAAEHVPVVVTAYFEMGRVSRGACKYLSFMRQPLGIRRPTVVFTQPRFASVIREIRQEALTASANYSDRRALLTAAEQGSHTQQSQFHLVTIDSWHAFPFSDEFRGQMYENVQSWRPHILTAMYRKWRGLPTYGSWLELLVPEYGMLNHAKIEFVRRAMDEVLPMEKSNASHFFWVDAGAMHGTAAFPKYWCPRRAMYENKKTLKTKSGEREAEGPRVVENSKVTLLADETAMAYQIALALLGEKDYRAISRLKKKELRAQYQSPLLHPLVKAQLQKHFCQKHFELGGWPKQVNMTLLDHMTAK